MARPRKDEDAAADDVVEHVAAAKVDSHAARANDGVERVRPLRTFEWRGKLTRPGARDNEIEVSRSEANELRSNGLIG